MIMAGDRPPVATSADRNTTKASSDEDRSMDQELFTKVQARNTSIDVHEIDRSIGNIFYYYYYVVVGCSY